MVLKSGLLRSRNDIFVSPLYSGIRHDGLYKSPRALPDVAEVLRA
jgi:hypothetical protein